MQTRAHTRTCIHMHTRRLRGPLGGHSLRRVRRRILAGFGVPSSRHGCMWSPFCKDGAWKEWAGTSEAPVHAALTEWCLLGQSPPWAAPARPASQGPRRLQERAAHLPCGTGQVAERSTGPWRGSCNSRCCPAGWMVPAPGPQATGGAQPWWAVSDPSEAQERTRVAKPAPSTLHELFSQPQVDMGCFARTPRVLRHRPVPDGCSRMFRWTRSRTH